MLLARFTTHLRMWSSTLNATLREKEWDAGGGEVKRITWLDVCLQPKEIIRHILYSPPPPLFNPFSDNDDDNFDKFDCCWVFSRCVFICQIGFTVSRARVSVCLEKKVGWCLRAGDDGGWLAKERTEENRTAERTKHWHHLSYRLLLYFTCVCCIWGVFIVCRYSETYLFRAGSGSKFISAWRHLSKAICRFHNNKQQQQQSLVVVCRQSERPISFDCGKLRIY